jgi:thiol-disulfide isomerase/thioredoxin
MPAGFALGLLVFAAVLVPDPQSSPQFQVYFFTATWCGPCKAVYPILDRYRQKESGCIAVTEIDFDRQREVAARFGVESVPVVLGSEVKGRSAFRIDGGGQEELRSLETALSECIRRCRSRK